MNRGTIETDKGTYIISQLFGENPDMYDQFEMDGHNGVDVVGLPRNYSLTEGDFYSSGFDAKGYGNWIKIRDAHGRIWTKAHFAHPVTARGHIKMFQDLGEMGSTGYSTGRHMHVGVKPANPNQGNGYLGSIDPLPLIRENINNYHNEDMTPEERKQLQDLVKFQLDVQIAMRCFRMVEGSGAIVYDAELAGKNPEDLKGTIWADSSSLAALMRAVGTGLITKEEAKKSKYVRVHSARELK